MNAVVELGFEHKEGTRWIGSGIIYGDQVARNQYALYVITNKHVLLTIAKLKKQVSMRFQRKDDEQSEMHSVPIERGNKSLWMEHESPGVDVAILALQVSDFWNRLCKCAIGSLRFHRLTQLSQYVQEGSPVRVVGFPYSVTAPSPIRAYPVVRGGVIARIADTYNGHNQRFLIDSIIYPGNSGGPVLAGPAPAVIQGRTVRLPSAIIGIVNGYLEHEEYDHDEDTEDDSVYREHAGLATVETVDSVFQTLDRLKTYLNS
jgi:S1-C subfamily serine protease